MLIQTISIARRLAAGARALAGLAAAALARSGRRRPDFAMLQWNERLLRDVGLTRSDFAGCLSSPWDRPDAFGQVHPVSHLRPAVCPARDIDRLAA